MLSKIISLIIPSPPGNRDFGESMYALRPMRNAERAKKNNKNQLARLRLGQFIRIHKPTLAHSLFVVAATFTFRPAPIASWPPLPRTTRSILLGIAENKTPEKHATLHPRITRPPLDMQADSVYLVRTTPTTSHFLPFCLCSDRLCE